MNRPPGEVTLRALSGEPLADQRIRGMVEATARAIAERQGVEVLGLESGPDRITVRLNARGIEAVGFAAELRRLTARWHARKYGGSPLWGEPPDQDDDQGEWWKR